MNVPVPQTRQQPETRPVGVIRPTHESALRALVALEQKCIADAEKHIAAIPDSPMSDYAWKIFLRGLAATEQVRLTKAEPLLLQASALALIDANADDREAGSEFAPGERRTGSPHARTPADAFRQAARALHHLGWMYRRQNREDNAYRTHLVAYRLREQHGSFDELWETAVELGLDADVARRYEDAQHWHRAATESAGRADDEAKRKQAIAWTNLSTSCTQGGLHDEAVSAARTARGFWREHDVGAVSAAQADLKLGSALLKQGESLHERDDKLARPALDEAGKWLTTAREALLAFGTEHAAEARVCLEQKDFARRLLTSFGA